MRKFYCAILSAFLLVQFVCKAEVSPDQERDLTRRWERIEKCDGKLGCRDLMYFIIEAGALKWQPEKISKALGMLVEMQDRDKTSKTYGNFRWYWEQPKPQDLNAVEFVSQQAVPFWNFHRNILSPGDQAKFKEMMEISVEGVKSHRVNIDYTNIILMKTLNYIGLGESLGKTDLANEGYVMLENWYKHISQNGIAEYNSTTYYAVDLDNLALIQKFAQRESGKELARKAIHYIYAQVKANWYYYALRLAGPRSRDYDYLTGHGDVERHAYLWGMILEYRKPSLDTIYNLTASEAPKDDKFVENLPLPRFNTLRWGAAEERIASVYVAKSFSIGVAGACAGPEDKFFAADFADQTSMVMMNCFMDGRGDPYGKNKEETGGGHMKSHHLIPFVTSSQVGADVLFSSSFVYDARKSAQLRCLQSHLYFPFEAEVWIGNELSREMDKNTRLYLRPSVPVFLRFRESVIAFRFLGATDTKGQEVLPILFRDGSQYKASRISWIHSEQSPEEEAHLVIWASGAEGLDDKAFAKFRDDFSKAKVEYLSKKGVITAKVTKVDGTEFHIESDPFAKKRVSDTKRPEGIFSINGIEVGSEILK